MILKKDIKYYSFILRAFLNRLIIKFLIKLGAMPYANFWECKRQDTNSDTFLDIGDIRYCFYTSKKMTLKSLDYYYKECAMSYLFARHDYDWEALIEDIKINGIQKNTIFRREGISSQYDIYDGNHRLRALQEIYGLQYEVEVDIYLSLFYRELKNKELRLKKGSIKKILKEKIEDIENKRYN